MSYQWKQYIFKPEDFDGAGQYLIRESINKESNHHIENTSFLSTIMLKVGYTLGTRRGSFRDSNIYCLIAMSDGLIREGYFTNTETEAGESVDTDKWIWNEFSGDTNYAAKMRLCDYLNNGPHKETYRFATQEEVVRVVMYQKSRWR